MGELLLCNEPLAEHPYFIEEISWNVYSMEELCYFIETNTYLLDERFMSEGLCHWIKDEMKRTALAEKLLTFLKQGIYLPDFVYLILRDTGYTSQDTTKQIVHLLKKMQKKSAFERTKIRADHLMNVEKYVSSILEYKRLLKLAESGTQDKILLGNIWNNMGTAYARLFIFQEAAHCYEKAFRRNRNEESLKQCLFCYGIMNEEAKFFQIAEKYKASERLLESIREEIFLAASSEQMQRTQRTLSELFKFSDTDINAKQRKEVSEVISDWKEEYRKKICLF